MRLVYYTYLRYHLLARSVSLYASFIISLFSLSSLLARSLIGSLYLSRCSHLPRAPALLAGDGRLLDLAGLSTTWGCLRNTTQGSSFPRTNHPRWPHLLAGAGIAFKQLLSYCWALLPPRHCLWVRIPAQSPSSFPLPPGRERANCCQFPIPPKSRESCGRRLRSAAMEGVCGRAVSVDVVRKAFLEQKHC